MRGSEKAPVTGKPAVYGSFMVQKIAKIFTNLMSPSFIVNILQYSCCCFKKRSTSTDLVVNPLHSIRTWRVHHGCTQKYSQSISHLSCRFHRPPAWSTYRSGWGSAPEPHGDCVVHTPVKRGLRHIPFLPEPA